jgi:hypothetical protein
MGRYYVKRPAGLAFQRSDRLRPVAGRHLVRPNGLTISPSHFHPFRPLPAVAVQPWAGRRCCCAPGAVLTCPRSAVHGLPGAVLACPVLLVSLPAGERWPVSFQTCSRPARCRWKGGPVACAMMRDRWPSVRGPLFPLAGPSGRPVPFARGVGGSKLGYSTIPGRLVGWILRAGRPVGVVVGWSAGRSVGWFLRLVGGMVDWSGWLGG